MIVEDLIQKIEKSVHFQQICPVDFKEGQSKEVKRYLSMLHPDSCSDPKGVEAFIKLSNLRDFYEKGVILDDGICITNFNGYHLNLQSFENEESWSHSIEVIRDIIKICESKSISLINYLPIVKNEDQLVFRRRSVPLKDLCLEQGHVNWVVSRLLEFSLFLGSIGYSHLGINPESVFINPDDHGIQVTGFYHSEKIGERVRTLSGKYRDWYPANIFSEKKAESVVDIELIKHLAAYLLGSKSSSIPYLKGKVVDPYIFFLLKCHTDTKSAFLDYREMIKSNFENKFLLLNL